MSSTPNVTDLIHRPRRLRQNESIRKLVRETLIRKDQLIYPLFVVEGKDIKKPIPSMPGQFQFSIDKLKAEINELKILGLNSVLLFGIPQNKDDKGLEALKDDGIVQKAIKAIKEVDSDTLVITDVCLCEYTDHGHCGPIKNNEVDNDSTLEIITKQALSHAVAGADMIAPSGMMDGMVSAIRSRLDQNGFCDTPVMSYCVKYASSFYGPFREAAECAPKFGDRRSYQMDPSNAREAITEAELDVKQGADILMVKPALAYLDVIRRIRKRFKLPLAAYNVSGEYSMVKAAAANGWINEEKVMLEILTSIKRAGADIIITYFAKDYAKLSKN